MTGEKERKEVMSEEMIQRADHGAGDVKGG